MLSRQMRAEFDQRGVVYLRGAFSEDAAAAMRRRVWARLARLGVLEHDQSTWAAAPVTGLNKAIKRDAVFTAAGSPAVLGAVDDLLGTGGWDPPPNWGTVMVTFPDRQRPWALPSEGWHPDYSHLHAPEPLFGVKVFAFFADVRPRSGGTLAIAGSHRVLARFAQSLPPEVRRDGTRFMPLFFKHDDWFRSPSRPGGDPERAAGFMDSDHQADGIAARVMELTARPGDVVLTHPWVLHCAAPNAGTYPRMMLTKNLYRRGVSLRNQADASR